jgi:hypothetical protein
LCCKRVPHWMRDDLNEFISRGSPDLTSRFYKFELGPIQIIIVIYVFVY